MDYSPSRYKEFTQQSANPPPQFPFNCGNGYGNAYPYADPYPMYPTFDGFQTPTQPNLNPNTISMPARSLNQIMKVTRDFQDNNNRSGPSHHITLGARAPENRQLHVDNMLIFGALASKCDRRSQTDYI